MLVHTQSDLISTEPEMHTWHTIPGMSLPGGGARLGAAASTAAPVPTPGSVTGRGDLDRGGDG